MAADLHLGLEHELWLGGVSIPSQTEKILARLLGYLAEIKPDRLLLLGDIKHNVPKNELAGEEGDSRFLAPAFAPRSRWRSFREIMTAIWLTWPPWACGCALPPALCWTAWAISTATPGRMKRSCARISLVAGHLHPAVRLKDPLGHSLTRPVWARARLLPRGSARALRFCQRQ